MRRLTTTGWIALFFALTLTACMGGPKNNQHLADKRTEVSFWGLVPTASQRVDVMIKNTFNGAWEPLTSYVAESSPATVDSTGVSWYRWGGMLRLPADSKYWLWLANNDVKAQVKALMGGYELTTFDMGSEACADAHVSKGVWDVIASCASASSPTVSITASCGKRNQSCCKYSMCQPGFMCTADDTCAYRPGPTPVSYTPVHDHPFRGELNWGNKGGGLEPQGAAQDGGFWYISHTKWVGFSPLGADLNRNLEEIRLSAIAPWDHIGDIDVYNGRMYLPLEGGPGGHAVASVDVAELRTLKAAAPVRITNVPGGHVAWVAINPVNEHMYLASEYEWVNVIQEYAFTDDAGGLKLTFVRNIPLTGIPDRRGLERLQGGAFGPDGSLYLAAFDDDEDEGGIHVFDQEGRRRTRIHVQYSPFSPTSPFSSEVLEGLTVADMNRDQSPGITGDVHILMYSGSKVYFKHFAANY